MFPSRIMQNFRDPAVVIFSNNKGQVVLLELAAPTEGYIVQWHIKKEDKDLKNSRSSILDQIF